MTRCRRGSRNVTSTRRENVFIPAAPPDIPGLFPRPLRRFADFSQELSHGSVVISLSKRLDFAVHLFLLFEEEAECSWGATHVYVYERKPNPEELERFLNPPDPSDI